VRLSLDVRIWKTRVRKAAKKRPYNVRWTVGGKEHNAYFATTGQADSFRATLIRARNDGQEFDIETGQPASVLREQQRKARSVTWMTHAREYARYKWPRLAGTARVSVAEVLTTVTVALLPQEGRDRPSDEALRLALRRWAFNAQQRDETEPPDVAAVLKWADANSPTVGALAELETLRGVLDACARKLNGKPVAATYLARRRQILHNVLAYAVTKKRLTSIPLGDPELRWERPSDMDMDHTLDARCVGNPRQVEQLLAAVSYVGRTQGPRFIAFFACMYYGMLRPEEVCGLRIQDCELPEEGWGKLTLEKTDPAPGKYWTDDGKVHESRGLKHRSRKAVRVVPIPPDLVRLIRRHIELFGTGRDGRIFRSVNGNPISPSTYNRVWSKARKVGLSPDQAASVLLKRPYDLRHSGITVRLYAGVPAKQVAQWAGHSVEVLHRTYSQVLDGFDDTWFERIDGVLRSKQTR
jgi:integrase